MVNVKQLQTFGIISISIFCLLIYRVDSVEAASEMATQVTPLIDVQARKNELANVPKRDRRKLCSVNFTTIALDKEAVISGHIQRQHSNVQMAGHALFQLVENYYYGDEYAAPDLRKALSQAVKIDAFTDVKPYHPKELPRSYNGFNEPYFQIAVFLTPLAHAYLILKAEYPEDKELHKGVKQWGDKLYSITVNKKNDFKGKTKGIDRRALHAMGYAHWGNATGNPKVLKTAYDYYKKALRCVGKGGRDRIWRHWAKKKDHVYYPNMTYQATLAAGFALQRSGYEDVYEMAPKKGTIIDGIEWLWDSVFDKNQFQLMKIQGSGSRTVAWAELFTLEFPDRPYADKMHNWLESKQTPVYGAFAGGPVSCLYRVIN